MLQDGSSLKPVVKVRSSRDGQTSWDGASSQISWQTDGWVNSERTGIYTVCVFSACNEEGEIRRPDE